MKKITTIFATALFSGCSCLFSQPGSEVSVYLITCGPGTDTYSIYGHTALRIVNPATGSDRVYNWGVFDFNTPNFAWKFARGRLEYMLGTDTFQRFQMMYLYERRWVRSQKINLDPAETVILTGLIKENLKPENLKYMYDFFYDDCSTRVRDLLEKSIGSPLRYKPDDKNDACTFRDLIGKYQLLYPWLKSGIDLLIGTPADRRASNRDRMFLPLELQDVLSDAFVLRDGKMVPLLTNPETLLDFDPPSTRLHLTLSPVVIFSLILVLLVIFHALCRKSSAVILADSIIFLVFALLAVIMIFFNFFSDHQQLKWNLNMLWLSPFLIFCFAALAMGREWKTCFRIVFTLSLVSFLLQVIFPHAFNQAFMPLVILLLFRSAARSGFSWNPLSA
jgi:hypothetical protein